MIIRKEKRFEITIQGETIPIVSYKTKAGINQDQQLEELNYNSDFYKEVLNTLSFDDFAESYGNNYKIYNKDEIISLLIIMAKKTELKKLTKDIVIGKYIREYLEGERGYNSFAENLKIRINQDGLLYAEYDYSIIKDKRISPVLEDLSRIIHDIKYEIATSTNEQLILELGDVLPRLLTVYTTIREKIIESLKQELNKNQLYHIQYGANKGKALNHCQEVADAIYELCIENNENLDYVNITIEELLAAVPNPYLSIAINEYKNDQKEDMILKLFAIVSKICRKEDGTQYKKSELEEALLKWDYGREKGGEFEEIIHDSSDASCYPEGDFLIEIPYDLNSQDYSENVGELRFSLTSKKQ